VVVTLAAVVVGLDREDAVLLLVDAAAGVGDGDDVVELLADVGGQGGGGGGGESRQGVPTGYRSSRKVVLTVHSILIENSAWRLTK